MKKYKILSMLLALGFFVGACKTEMIEPIDLDALETGGYVRTVTPYPVGASTFNYSAADMAGTKMEFLAEAVTPNKGADFASYELVIKFVDATPANGTKTTAALPLKVLQASSFTKDATTGYPRATITVTGTEALTATKLTTSDIAVGDRFEITGTMKLTNGKSFSISNTGANITGGAFYSSPFFYRVNVIK
ncbi:hypothetical protein [Flectobacillus major]|uniref:hypothetical protein n=1 Tax=Flectobacillus major TaxID=103 RepID=UPI00047C50D5|nr:hypothetical protein [Flectobacillus major]